MFARHVINLANKTGLENDASASYTREFRARKILRELLCDNRASVYAGPILTDAVNNLSMTTVLEPDVKIDLVKRQEPTYVDSTNFYFYSMDKERVILFLE